MRTQIKINKELITSLVSDPVESEQVPRKAVEDSQKEVAHLEGIVLRARAENEELQMQVLITEQIQKEN